MGPLGLVRGYEGHDVAGTMSSRVGPLATLLLSYTLVAQLASHVSGMKNNPVNRQNQNITELLDSLLEGYNRHLRPGFGGAVLRWAWCIRGLGWEQTGWRSFRRQICYIASSIMERQSKICVPGAKSGGTTS